MSSSAAPLSQDPVSTFPAAWRSRYWTFASHALTVCILVNAAYFAGYPLFGKSPWMTYEEDDFFYYLKIADNLAHGFGSTFNGIVHTNGYHPLWLALLTLVVRISSAPHVVLLFLALAIFSSIAATYFLCRRIFACHVDNPLLKNALAGSIAIYSSHLYDGGMEIILTIPLVLAVVIVYQESQLWLPRLMPAFGFGLLLSALCLSRLDTTLIVALLATATLMHPALRARLGSQQIAGVMLGFVPVPLYLLSNHLLFHTWMPVSGMAKQLKSSHLPAWQAWRGLLTFGEVPHICLILIAIVILPLVYRRLTSTQQVIYPILLVFPFFYIFVLSCLSDWPLSLWYFYSLRVAVCISLAIFLLYGTTSRLLNYSWVVIILALLVSAQAIRNQRSTNFGLAMYYPNAVSVRDFAITHPGTYAMGDRAGLVGYLISAPVVHTEGLVMDRDFLTLIRKRTPLKEVFARYHVRYYVVATYEPITACFHAVEPLWAGPDSPHMEDDFCQPPVARFAYYSGQTVIFDLDQNRAAIAKP
jgi:hypothetical protein